LSAFLREQRVVGRQARTQPALRILVVAAGELETQVEQPARIQGLVDQRRRIGQGAEGAAGHLSLAVDHHLVLVEGCSLEPRERHHAGQILFERGLNRVAGAHRAVLVVPVTDAELGRHVGARPDGHGVRTLRAEHRAMGHFGGVRVRRKAEEKK